MSMGFVEALRMVEETRAAEAICARVREMLLIGKRRHFTAAVEWKNRDSGVCTGRLNGIELYRTAPETASEIERLMRLGAEGEETHTPACGHPSPEGNLKPQPETLNPEPEAA